MSKKTIQLYLEKYPSSFQENFINNFHRFKISPVRQAIPFLISNDTKRKSAIIPSET